MIANSDRESSTVIFSDRVFAGWEIVSVCSSAVIAEWLLASTVGFSKVLTAVPVALALFLMYSSHRMRGESLRDLGFRFDNFLPALYLLAVPVGAFALVCLIAGWRMGGGFNFFRWHPGRYLVVQLVAGFLWGAIQQYALQSFINRRAMICVGRGAASVFLVGAIFGLLHLPNLWVAGLTLIGGLVWATVYQRVPNIFALALSHALMTWFVVSTLPPSALRHLRVGIRYFG